MALSEVFKVLVLFSGVASLASGHNGRSGRPERLAVVHRNVVPSRHVMSPGSMSAGPMMISLFGRKVRVRLEDNSELTSGRSKFFTGKVVGYPNSEVFLLVNEDGASGSVKFGGRWIQLLAKGGGLVEETELDPAKVGGGEDEEPSVRLLHEPSMKRAQLGPSSERASAQNTIDLVVFYTKRALSENGGAKGMANKIEMMEGDMNTGYKNSGLPTRVRVVHSTEVSYNEDSGSWGDHLDLFRGTSDGEMDEVHDIREEFGGDACILFVAPTSDGSTAGIGYIESSFSTAFSVVENQFAAASTGAHELGHNFGCGHDENTGGSAGDSWARGYQNVAKQVVTIMAYRCSGCDRINVHSSPSQYEGMKVGDAGANCKKKIMERTEVMADFSPTKVNTKPSDPPPTSKPKPTAKPTPRPTSKPKPTQPPNPTNNKCRRLGESKFSNDVVTIYVENNQPMDVDIFYMTSSSQNMRELKMGTMKSGSNYNINVNVGTVMRMKPSGRPNCMRSFVVRVDRKIFLGGPK